MALPQFMLKRTWQLRCAQHSCGLLSVWLLISCTHPENATSSAPNPYCIPQDLLSEIQLYTVKEDNVKENLHFTGAIAVNPNNVLQFRSLVSGFASKVYFSLGDRVSGRKGASLSRNRKPRAFRNAFKSRGPFSSDRSR